MQPRNKKLITFGVASILIGFVMLFCTSYDPNSAWAGYALASTLGGLAITSIGINDETKQARKQQAQRHHPAGTTPSSSRHKTQPARSNQ
jgi:hypothetical protein